VPKLGALSFDTPTFIMLTSPLLSTGKPLLPRLLRLPAQMQVPPLTTSLCKHAPLPPAPLFLSFSLVFFFSFIFLSFSTNYFIFSAEQVLKTTGVSVASPKCQCPTSTSHLPPKPKLTGGCQCCSDLPQTHRNEDSDNEGSGNDLTDSRVKNKKTNENKTNEGSETDEENKTNEENKNKNESNRDKSKNKDAKCKANWDQHENTDMNGDNHWNDTKGKGRDTGTVNNESASVNAGVVDNNNESTSASGNGGYNEGGSGRDRNGNQSKTRYVATTITSPQLIMNLSTTHSGCKGMILFNVYIVYIVCMDDT